MHRKRSNRIVNLEEPVEERHGPDNEEPCHHSNEESHRQARVVRACGDANESGKGTVQHYRQIDLSVEQLGEDECRNGPSTCCDVGVGDHGGDRIDVVLGTQRKL